MKNTNETLSDNKLYTTRMSDCVNRQFDFEGYVISIKGYPKKFEPKRHFNPEKETQIFVKGKGKVRFNQNNIESVEIPKIETYNQLFELVQKYGYRCASEMAGLSLDNYGDHYPISDISMMETFGITYVEWLEKIAELDFLILQYLSFELKLKIQKNSYDMFIGQGEGENYKCLFRKNPFLGYALTTCLYGMIPMKPHIDPISFDDTLWAVISEFHPDFIIADKTANEIETLKGKFDAISVKGWVKIMCGEENANWLSENLTFKGSPLSEMSDLDTSPLAVATLAAEVSSPNFKAKKNGRK